MKYCLQLFIGKKILICALAVFPGKLERNSSYISFVSTSSVTGSVVTQPYRDVLYGMSHDSLTITRNVFSRFAVVYFTLDRLFIDNV